jgi:hypothetical protein
MIVSGEGSPCSYNGKPFINDCQYDAAGFLLAHVYGSLKPRGAPLSGSVIEYDQRDFFGTGDHAAYVHSMSDSGFAYIPAPCSTRPCRVHVAFHGCKQNYEAVGDQFYIRSGFCASCRPRTSGRDFRSWCALLALSRGFGLPPKRHRCNTRGR